MIEIKHKIVTENGDITDDKYIIDRYFNGVCAGHKRLLDTITVDKSEMKQLKEEINKIDID